MRLHDWLNHLESLCDRRYQLLSRLPLFKMKKLRYFVERRSGKLQLLYGRWPQLVLVKLRVHLRTDVFGRMSLSFCQFALRSNRRPVGANEGRDEGLPERG